MIAGELVKGLGSIGEMSKIVKDSSDDDIFYDENIKSPLAIYVFYHISNSNGAIYTTRYITI